MSKRIDGVTESAMQGGNMKSSKATESVSIPFSDFLNEAISTVNPDEKRFVEHNFNQNPAKVKSLSQEDELIAQGLDPDDVEGIFREVQNERNRQAQDLGSEDDYAYLDTNRIEVTPFQLVIDKAIEVLESISVMDYRVNDLTEQYIQGKVSIDEVSFETMKLNLAVSFATTILSSATQAFNEIKNLAI